MALPHRVILLICLLSAVMAPAVATVDVSHDPGIPLDGDRLSGVVLPVEARNGNINLNAMKADIWTVEDTKRLVLTGDITVQIAGWTFEGEDAVVWLNRIHSAEGLVNQVAVYFPEAWNRTSEAGRGPQGRNLLVVGSARGSVRLNVALLNKDSRVSNGLNRKAEQRLAQYLQDLQVGAPALAVYPQVLGAADEPDYIPTPGGTLPSNRMPEGQLARDQRPWLNTPGGVVSFSARTVKLDPGDEENVLVADGAVVLDYRPAGSGSGNNLRLSAERAVVFLEPGSVKELASRSLDSKDVRGVYLEGAVLAESDKDNYVVRAPRMYYDFKSDRAIMLDAVLRTYDRKRNLPVYARAEEMRQLATDQWTAEHATVSSSSFHTPTLAIGARSVVVSRAPSGLGQIEQEERGELMIDSMHTTLQAGGTPILWWPRYVGPAHKIPLRGVRSGWDEYEGAIVETTWDLYSLIGQEPPSGWDMTIDIDGYTKRGVGLGYDFTIDQPDNQMDLDLYGLKDSGEQRVDTGLTMDVPKEYRYAALWEQTMKLSSQWTMQGQLSYFSDSTFVSAWREEDYRERREYETSLYLKREHRNTAFTALGTYSLNDFISNSWLMGSQGYQVNKLPELTYQRFGDSLFGDMFTWSSDYRASRMQIVIPDGTSENNGLRAQMFDSPGVQFRDNQPISEAARYAGLRQSWVNRISTRQELAMPLQWGAFNITPFAMAQSVAYFEDPTIPNAAGARVLDDEKHQLYGSGGVRINTMLQRIYDGVDNELLDMHRLRHLIEPYVTLWYGTSNYDADRNALYDPVVDALSTGGLARFGVTNTLQTHRGGPGRWYEVDWLTVDAAIVLSTDSATNRWPTPQYFSWEPGYSQLGNFAEGSYTWQFSDSLSFVGEGIYDFDESRFDRASTGFRLDHSPQFFTYAEYRFIHITDSKLLSFGGIYEVSDKYTIGFTPQWDFVEDDFRSIRASVVRSFPDFDFMFYIGYDQVRGETRVGAQLGQVNY
ncbi:MAG: hypothetical protein VX908_07005 [Planctomycetota bacterium]|nr:hypothetical protein [Planctomycetota bacterium]